MLNACGIEIPSEEFESQMDNGLQIVEIHLMDNSIMIFLAKIEYPHWESFYLFQQISIELGAVSAGWI